MRRGRGTAGMSTHDPSALPTLPPALLGLAPLHTQPGNQLLGRFQVPHGGWYLWSAEGGAESFKSSPGGSNGEPGLNEKSAGFPDLNAWSQLRAEDLEQAGRWWPVSLHAVLCAVCAITNKNAIAGCLIPFPRFDVFLDFENRISLRKRPVASFYRTKTSLVHDLKPLPLRTLGHTQGDRSASPTPAITTAPSPPILVASLVSAP